MCTCCQGIVTLYNTSMRTRHNPTTCNVRAAGTLARRGWGNCLILAGLIALAPALWAVQESTSTVEPLETDQTTSSQESEAKGIIPPNADTLLSTQPITPISTFPEKTPYEEAKDELIKALELWNAGHAEAASDTALQAYDDLIEMHRIPGVKRSKIRAQIHQAAEVYVRAGITYVQNYVKQAGSNKDALDEGRARLEDLRDVARNYHELDKMLQMAIDDLPTLATAKPK